jgi:glycosyltransferase involved in cell wall biosynthesis
MSQDHGESWIFYGKIGNPRFTSHRLDIETGSGKNPLFLYFVRHILMVKLSVVIITFNEERNIRRCLESVRDIADETVVVDSFSTDATETICREMGARFEQHPFSGHIEQKNHALSRAQFDHVLSLDADEALSPRLAESIRNVKTSWDCDGYTMNRLTNYCGKWIRHSGWYPDRKLRLIRRNKAAWGGVNPHDRLILAGGSSTQHLKGDLLHYSYYTIDDHIRQVEKFADIASKAMFAKGMRSGPLKLLVKPLARFLKSYIIKLGFLDGPEGYTIARMTARAAYLRYSKLLQLQRNG